MCKSSEIFFIICFGPHFWKIACLFTGHVFAYGLSRSAAITNMALALKEIQIRGEIHSNVDYTVDLLNVRSVNHLLKPPFPFVGIILSLCFFSSITPKLLVLFPYIHSGFRFQRKQDSYWLARYQNSYACSSREAPMVYFSGWRSSICKMKK